MRKPLQLIKERFRDLITVGRSHSWGYHMQKQSGL